MIYFGEGNIEFIYIIIDIRKEKTNEVKWRESQMKLKLKSWHTKLSADELTNEGES